MSKSLDDIKKIKDEEAANNNLEEEGELAKLLPKAVQAYLSCKEDGKPGRKLTKKHINSII